MSKKKNPLSSEFNNEVARLEKFTLLRAMQIADEIGIFDDYDFDRAIERDKRVQVRSLIGSMRDENGERIVRSYKDKLMQSRQYLNVLVTRDTEALDEIIRNERDIMDSHSHIIIYVSRRKGEIEGQISIEEWMKQKEETNDS